MATYSELSWLTPEWIVALANLPPECEDPMDQLHLRYMRRISEKKEKKTNKPIPYRMTVWPFPHNTIKRLMVDTSEIFQRPQFNIDSLVNFWKLLPSSTVERFFIFHHCAPNASVSFAYSTEMIWLMRNAFVEPKIQEPHGEARLRLAFKILFHTNTNGERERWATDIGFMRLVMSDPATKNYGTMIADILTEIYAFCRTAFLLWARSVDQEWALRKLAVVVPRYSNMDRRRIMITMENRRPSNRIDFLQRLFTTVGKENFETLVFGRLRKCGTCGATNREKFLWCCRACVEEGIRPKRRYCNKKCQRAGWKKHRKIHPNWKKPETETEAKAQASQGKSGKKGKKKRKNKW